MKSIISGTFVSLGLALLANTPALAQTQTQGPLSATCPCEDLNPAVAAQKRAINSKGPHGTPVGTAERVHPATSATSTADVPKRKTGHVTLNR